MSFIKSQQQSNVRKAFDVFPDCARTEVINDANISELHPLKYRILT